MATETIKINRAPVMTLWAAVVAERLGHSPETALTLGRAVAGLNAQSKARHLGLVEAKKLESETPREPAAHPAKTKTVALLGRAVPVTQTKEGLRAVSKDTAIKPDSVQRYLQGRFGEHLPAVRKAMEALAAAYPSKELETEAYGLYEQFRPSVPEGQKGWGAAGALDLTRIRKMAGRAKS